MRLATFVALAATQAAQAASAPSSAVSAGQIGQLALGLVMVLALIAGCALLVRRLPIIRSARNSALRIVETIPLGTRDRLMLVDAEGTRMLIGVTTGSIACLHVLGRADQRMTQPAPGFASHLREATDPTNSSVEHNASSSNLPLAGGGQGGG